VNRQQALVIRVGDRRVGDHWGKDLEDAYERFMRAYELTEKNCLVREVPALGSTAGIRGLLSLWPTSRWVFIVVPFVSGQTESETVISWLTQVLEVGNRAGLRGVTPVVLKQAESGPFPWIWSLPRHSSHHPWYLTYQRACGIAHILEQSPLVKNIWLYGSVARGARSGRSISRTTGCQDIDICIQTSEADEWIRGKFQELCERNTDKPRAQREPLFTRSYPVMEADFMLMYGPVGLMTAALREKIERITDGQRNDDLSLDESLLESREPSRVVTKASFILWPTVPNPGLLALARTLCADPFFWDSLEADALCWNGFDFKLEPFPGSMFMNHDRDYRFIKGKTAPFEDDRIYLDDLFR